MITPAPQPRVAVCVVPLRVRRVRPVLVVPVLVVPVSVVPVLVVPVLVDLLVTVPVPASLPRVDPAASALVVSPPLGARRPVAPPVAVAPVAVRALAGVRRVPGVRAVSAGARRMRAAARGRLVHESEAAVGGRCRACAVKVGKGIGARGAESRTVFPPPCRAAPPRGGLVLGVRDERATSHRRVLVVLRRVIRARRAPCVCACGHERNVGVLAVVLQALAREVDGLRRGDAAERHHAAHAVVAGPARRVGDDRKAGTGA